MNILPRQNYIDQIEKNLGKDYVIVPVGQRRVGKSYMLKMISCIKEKNAGVGGNLFYVQASYIISDEETSRREFGNLASIKDNYPKYVISMTPLVTKSDDNGIAHLGLRTFLMTENI